MKKRVRLDAKDPKDSKEAKGGKEGKDGNREDKTVDNVTLEDEAQNEGFSEWLRSNSGVELMRLFVIANSLVVFVTMAWPNMQEALFIIKDFIMGEEDDTSVWKMIDVYFKNRFESYLRAEYDKNPHMLADIEAYRAAAGKESPAAPSPEGEEHLDKVGQACSADVRLVSNEDDVKMSAEIPAKKDPDFGKPSDVVEPETPSTTESPPPVVGENETTKVQEKSPEPTDELLKNDSAKRGNGKKKTRPIIAPGKAQEGKAAKKRLKTITLTEKDFQSTRIKVTSQDFAEFDLDEDAVHDVEDEPVGILVSELPFKPKADIGDLKRVSPDEFCPLTLEDEFSCDETKTWP